MGLIDLLIANSQCRGKGGEEAQREIRKVHNEMPIQPGRRTRNRGAIEKMARQSWQKSTTGLKDGTTEKSLQEEGR